MSPLANTVARHSSIKSDQQRFASHSNALIRVPEVQKSALFERIADPSSAGRLTTAGSCSGFSHPAATRMRWSRRRSDPGFHGCLSGMTKLKNALGRGETAFQPHASGSHRGFHGIKESLRGIAPAFSGTVRAF
jgi:hypothetical protein